MSDRVFYITTPIYYINDLPHLGHAYTTVAADVLARWRRLEGKEVYFLTGTDEHGQKVARAAEAKGMAPKEWADQMVPRWTEVWELLDISNDDFIRTTEARHEGPVGSFAQALFDKGEVYKGTYKGLYCVGCEEFKQPDQLVDGKCPLHGVEPDVVEEDNYFFRLSKYRDALIELYENHPEFVRPESRRNEVLGKVSQGLEDLSMSRVSFEWGIPIPWDNQHVIYVWIDALQNYITAVGYGRDEKQFERIWPADVHFIGKDILWFHSVIWPAMLMAVGLPLPRTVYAHGFLQVGGEKMSKSKATGISPAELVATFGSDGYRYYFMREISFGQDGSFSWESMVARYNSELANELGNLVSRVSSMVGRYLGGSLPEPPAPDELNEVDRRLEPAFTDVVDEMNRAMDDIAPHEALKAAWRFVKAINSYIDDMAPWHLAKDDSASRRLEVVLFRLAEALRLIAIITSPAIPRTAQEIWRRLSQDGKVEEAVLAKDAVWGVMKAGTEVLSGPPLFPRVESD